MVKLRSQRFGSKKSPFYRIVATDSRNPRDGRFIEVVGTYNPLTNPATVNFDAEKVQKWLAVGAKPTDTVKSFLKQQGLLAADKKESLLNAARVIPNKIGLPTAKFLPAKIISRFASMKAWIETSLPGNNCVSP